MAKAILRVSGIKTTGDLRGIGKHNVDRISETNFDIDRESSNENITLKSCGGNYNLMFEEITRDLKNQHDEQMKTTRKSRQKSFHNKINDDKADVACEFLLSASPEYFKGKSREEVGEWAKISLDFITKKIGIEEKNVLHAIVHMDEKTPHLHVVAVPLIEKYDGRKKKDVLAISRKHFIKNREEMAQVQTDYVDHLKENGIDLERGQEKSGAKHLDVTRYKLQETQKDLKEIEINLGEKAKDLLEKNEQLKTIEEKIEKNIEAVPSQNFKFKKDLKKEIKTEVIPKLIGKPEIIKTETGNVVFSPKQLERMENTINAAVTIKKDYERLQTTDLVQDNKGLRSHAIASMNESRDLRHENARLRNENQELRSEVSYLKGHINELKLEISSIYKSTKEYFKERTSDFKQHVRDFVAKVADKEPGSEFEQNHKRERRHEMNRGIGR